MRGVHGKRPKVFRDRIVKESTIAISQGKSIREFAQDVDLPTGTVSSWRSIAGVRSCKRNRSKMLPKEPIVRSGSNYIAGHDYTEYLISISSSLHEISLIMRVLSTVLIFCLVFTALYWFGVLQFLP